MSLLRFGGKDPEGNAKGVNVDDDGNLVASRKPQILIDDQFTVTNSGFHVFGGTIGRGHQQILNIDDYNNIQIEIFSPDDSEADPGPFHLLFYNDNGRNTDSMVHGDANDPTTGSGVVFDYDVNIKEGKSLTAGSRFIFHPFDYHFLNSSCYKGMVVLFSQSTPVGAVINVKIIGGF